MGSTWRQPNECRDRLVAAGVDAPEWGDVVRGQRPGFDPDDEFPTISRFGWQSFASSAVEGTFFRSAVWPRLGLTEQALARSQQGPMAGIPFHCSPTSPASRLDPQCFRVLLLRRLWCPLLLSSTFCRCCQPLDSRGHHRAACATSGVLGRRGFPLESCAARICREAGARVSTNIRVQDLDLLPGGQLDDRRLEVVADGLPSLPRCPVGDRHDFGQSCRADGTTTRDSVPPETGLLSTRHDRTKERRYPELTGEYGRARAWLSLLARLEADGRRKPRFLATSRPCQSKVGTTGDPHSGATLLVQTLVHSIVMLCCAGVRLVTVGAPWRSGC